MKRLLTFLALVGSCLAAPIPNPFSSPEALHAYLQSQFGGGGGSAPTITCGDSTHALGYSGGAWSCQAITGAAAAGGSTTQLQYNNATALGGIAGFTTNGTTTITAGATGVLDLHAAGTGGLLFPGAFGTGIVRVTTTTGAMTSGELSGDCTTSLFAVTCLKTNGVSFSGMATASTTGAGDVTGTWPSLNVVKVNGTLLSTLSTGLLKVTTGTGAISVATPGTDYNIYPGAGVANSTGTAWGTSFAVGTAGNDLVQLDSLGKLPAVDGSQLTNLPSGFSNPMTTLGDVITGGVSGAAGRLAGPTATNGVAQILTSTPSAGAATAPVWAPPGVSGRAVTATSDTIAATDRAAWVTYNAATAVGVTLPQAGTTGFASDFVFGLKNLGAGAVTVTPTVSTIDGNATLVVTQGQNCSITSLDNTNYVSRCSSGQVTAGTGISITPSPSGIAIASTSSGGTVTTTGSPASGQPTAFSGTTSITTATAHNLESVLVCSDSSASGTAKSCTTSPSFTPAANDCVIFVSTTNNTGALTWNVNSLGTTAVKKWLGTALASGDIVANKPVLGCYDGTNWDMEDIGNAPSGGATTATAYNVGTTLTTGNQISSTINQELLVGLYTPFAFTISNIGYYVAVADTSASDAYGIAIYDSSGTRQCSVNGVLGGVGNPFNSTGLKTAACSEGTNRTIAAGQFYIGFTGTATAGKIAALTGSVAGTFVVNSSFGATTSGNTLTSITPPANSPAVSSSVPWFMAY